MRKLFFVITITGLLWGFTEREQEIFWHIPRISDTPTNDHAKSIRSDFTKKFGKNWQFSWNENGTPHRIFGTGIPLGNILDSNDVVNLCTNFINENNFIFNINSDDLKPIVIRRFKNNWTVTFRQHYFDIPVIGGRIDFRINSNRLVLIGADCFPALSVDIEPALKQDECASIARRVFEFNQYKADLWILPEDKGKLVWHIEGKNKKPAHLWHILVDAHTGEILQWMDYIKTTNISGHINGRMLPYYYNDPPHTLAFIHINVYTDLGDSATTDSSGFYQLPREFSPTIIVFSQLMGPYADVVPVSEIHSFCGGTFTSPEIDILWGAECSQIDESNVFWHTNFIHDWYKLLDPEYTGMDYPVPVIVSDTVDPCPENAFWDGEGMHFGAGGASSRNFGLFSDVIYHEYAHGVTHYIYPWDILPYNGEPGALDEGFSDYFPCSIFDDPLMGEGGLLIYQEYMRNLDNNYRRPENWVNEVHWDSQIITGAWWEIRESLGAGYTDSLVHFARFAFPNNFDDFAMEMLILDDDDGNLANGTPNALPIVEAFMNHGIGDFGVRIYHTPLRDTEQDTGFYLIYANIYGIMPVTLASVSFFTSEDSVIFSVEMAFADTLWYAEIPSVSWGNTVCYKIFAIDEWGLSDTFPIDSFHCFYVGRDTIAPEIKHKVLGTQPEMAKPYSALAKATDNTDAPVEVFFVWGVNTGEPETLAANYIGGNLFSVFLDPIGHTTVGDSIWYAVLAKDGARTPNWSRIPDSEDEWFVFKVVRGWYFNFESSDGEFVSTDGWEWGQPVGWPEVHEGMNIWGTVLDGDYGPNAQYYLTSPYFDIRDYSCSVLRFAHIYRIQRFRDGGLVQVQAGTGDWQTITPVGGYPSPTVSSLGEAGYSGETTEWQLTEFDLTPFVGESIRVRFVFKSNDNNQARGWYIDNFTLMETNVLLPPKGLFAESGWADHITLKWVKPSEAVIRYDIYRSETRDEMPDEPYTSIDATVSNWNDYSVSECESLFYWVVAIYPSGSSVPAGPVWAMPFDAEIFVASDSVYVVSNYGMTFDTTILIQNLADCGWLTFDTWEFNHDPRTLLRQTLVPDPTRWHLLAFDPEEGVRRDIKEFWGQSLNNGEVYFRVIGYHRLGNPDSGIVITIAFDTDRNPSTGSPAVNGCEYIVGIGSMMGYTGMILRYDPTSPYGWSMVGPPSYIRYSANVDTAEVGFSTSSLGSPSDVSVWAVALAGLAGTTPVVEDIAPDSTLPPGYFVFPSLVWLDQRPASKTLYGGDTTSLVLRFRTYLPDGIYNAWIQITSSDRENREIVIPVVLQIGTKVEEQTKPHQILFHEPVPNPFNSAVSLKFDIPTTMQVKLAIFDITGHCISVLVDGVVEAGSHTLVWKPENILSGIYFVQMTTHGFNEKKRVILLK